MRSTASCFIREKVDESWMGRLLGCAAGVSRGLHQEAVSSDSCNNKKSPGEQNSRPQTYLVLTSNEHTLSTIVSTIVVYATAYWETYAGVSYCRSFSRIERAYHEYNRGICYWGLLARGYDSKVDAYFLNCHQRYDKKNHIRILNLFITFFYFQIDSMPYV